MKLALLFMMVLMVGCSQAKDGSNGSNGASGHDGSSGSDGTNGGNGLNGHDVVSVARIATSLECPLNGGTAVDFYMDLDSSETYTSGDLLESGVVACNGTNGVNGSNGSNGTNGSNGSSAVMTAYTLVSNVCTQVDTSMYAMKVNNTDVTLYTANTCLAANQVDTGNVLNYDYNELYATGNTLFIVEGSSTSLVLRKLVYQ